MLVRAIIRKTHTKIEKNEEKMKQMIKKAILLFFIVIKPSNIGIKRKLWFSRL